MRAFMDKNNLFPTLMGAVTLLHNYSMLQMARTD